MKRLGKKRLALASALLLILLAGLLLHGTRTRRAQTDAAAENVCTLSVRCDTLLAHRDELDDELARLIPADGVLLAETTLAFTAGETVFDLTQRALRAQEIPMEFSSTPFYRSVYVEGIGNLYEFDCGALSGWMYRVNGTFPSYGSSRCTLSPGDRVEWVYTCDLGADVGDDFYVRQE